MKLGNVLVHPDYKHQADNKNTIELGWGGSLNQKLLFVKVSETGKSEIKGPADVKSNELSSSGSSCSKELSEIFCFVLEQQSWDHLERFHLQTLSPWG